jgi:hypothetical protein
MYVHCTGSGTGSGKGSCTGSDIGSGTGSGIGSCTGSDIGSGTGSGVGSCTGSGIGSGTGSGIGSGTAPPHPLLVGRPIKAHVHRQYDRRKKLLENTSVKSADLLKCCLIKVATRSTRTSCYNGQ